MSKEDDENDVAFFLQNVVNKLKHIKLTPESHPALQKMERLTAFLAEGGLNDIEPTPEDIVAANTLQRKMVKELRGKAKESHDHIREEVLKNTQTLLRTVPLKHHEKVLRSLADVFTKRQQEMADLRKSMEQQGVWQSGLKLSDKTLEELQKTIQVTEKQQRADWIGRSGLKIVKKGSVGDSEKPESPHR